jgi:hypothetical protein
LSPLIDPLVTFEENIPQQMMIEDKTLTEQVKLIQELEPDKKNMVFKMVDAFLT